MLWDTYRCFKKKAFLSKKELNILVQSKVAMMKIELN
jgi:hypothetical protein